MTFVYPVFLALAWLWIECMVGGTRLLYSLPAYGVLAIGSLLTLASVRGKRTPPDPFCLGATLLLGAWILVRASLSPVEYLAWPDFYMMMGCLIVYLITALYLSGTAEQSALIAVLWAIAALEVWVGMVQFGKDQNFMLFGFLRHPGERASGMYISPNNFAGLLVTVAILSISLGVWSRWRVWAKIMAFYVALFCLLGVAVSGSRGGYFAAIASLLAFAIGSILTVRAADPRKFVPMALAISGGFVVVVGLAAFLMFNSGFLAHRIQTMMVKDVRIYNWQAALDHIRVSPWIGTGAGTHLIYGRLFRRPQIQVDPVHAHCDYLELLAEYGVVGAGCMALFLTAHTRRALRSLSEILHARLIPSGLLRSNRFAIHLGALCAVAGLAIHSVVDFDMHIPGNALIFAFLFGVLANPGIEPERAVALSRGLMPFAKALPPLLGIFILWRGIPLLPSEYCAEMARASLRDHADNTSISYAQLGIGSAPDLDPVAPIAPLTPSAPAATPQPTVPPVLTTLIRKMGPIRKPNLYLYLGEANRALGMPYKSLYMLRPYYTRADAAYKAGLKVFPQDETLLVRDGQVLDGLRNYDEAEARYQKALAWDPNLEMVNEYYERHLIAEGREIEAAAIAQKRRRAAPVAVDPGQVADFPLQ